jgi:hypothetical protein
MSNKKNKNRVYILQYIAENDPERLRNRTVKPEKGKGKKERPRNNNWYDESLNYAA